MTAKAVLLAKFSDDERLTASDIVRQEQEFYKVNEPELNASFERLRAALLGHPMVALDKKQS